MKDSTRLLMHPATEFPLAWIRLSRNCRPAHWDKINDPAVLLECKFCGQSLAGSVWERKLVDNLLQRNEDFFLKNMGMLKLSSKGPVALDN